MSNTRSVIRTWAPVAGAGCALIAAMFYGWSTKSRAAEAVRRLSNLGMALSSMSEQVIAGALTPTDAGRLDTDIKEAMGRLEDSTKSHLVVMAISETTRSVGAEAIEIMPVPRPPTQPGEATHSYPRYRVVLDGTVQQLAEFMDDCATERLPVRVVEFTITQTNQKGKDGLTMLHGDVVVEAFEPKPVANRPNGAA